MWRIVDKAAQLACGICITLLPAVALAQPGEIELDHLAVEDGLSHSTVHSIHQDTRGFLWFGTQEGLNRYDGYSFEVFKHDPDDPASLPDSWITAVYGDRRGQLWVGTPGGLSRLRPRGEGFVHYRHDPADDLSLGAGNVQALLEDRDGGLWIGTGTGLDRLFGPGGEFSHHRPAAAGSDDAPAIAVLALHQDPDGGLWIGTPDGLYRLDRASVPPEGRRDGALSRYQQDENGAGNRLNGKISAIRGDPDGLLWLAAGDGLLRLEPRGGALDFFPYQDLAPGSAGEHLATALAIARGGDVWVGFESHGVSRLDPDSGRSWTGGRFPEKPAEIKRTGGACLRVGDHSRLPRLRPRLRVRRPALPESAEQPLRLSAGRLRSRMDRGRCGASLRPLLEPARRQLHLPGQGLERRRRLESGRRGNRHPRAAATVEDLVGLRALWPGSGRRGRRLQPLAAAQGRTRARDQSPAA